MLNFIHVYWTFSHQSTELCYLLLLYFELTFENYFYFKNFFKMYLIGG